MQTSTSRPNDEATNGLNLVRAKRMQQVIDAIDWAKVCLREAKKDFGEQGKTRAKDTVREIVGELTGARQSMWELYKAGDRHLAEESPKYGEYPEFPDHVDAEMREWITQRFEEIYEIVREVVEMVKARGDFMDFPQRQHMSDEWTKFNLSPVQTATNDGARTI